ncbi:MAG: hypothetical protein H7841_11830 [Magnetospirillum sp. WYHS-4]
MAGFFRKAMAVLGLEARKPPARKATPKDSPPRKAGPERQALMRQALDLRKDKKKILESLGEEDRARLLTMAILAFTDAAKGKDNDGK